MPVETLVPLEEYLNTSYEPDCDYVDGFLLERNAGKFDHSRMQFRLAVFLGNMEKELGLIGVTEERMKVGSKRIRIPDLCVLLQNQPTEQVLNTPPFLCIEILSPDDIMTSMQEGLMTTSTAASPLSGSSIRGVASLTLSTNM